MHAKQRLQDSNAFSLASMGVAVALIDAIVD